MLGKYGISSVTTPQSGDVITTENVKKRLGIAASVTGHDDRIDDLRAEARQFFEDETDRHLMQRTHVLTLDDFPPKKEAIHLPFSPVSSITSITYDTTDTDDVAFTDFVFSSHTTPPRISLSSATSTWPTTKDQDSVVNITLVSGHALASDIDDSIKRILMMLVCHWFNNPDAAQEKAIHAIPYGIQMSIDKKRLGNGYLRVSG